MLAPHFSKSILFTATRSLRGMQFAAWTTAVAPYPKRKESCFKHCLIWSREWKSKLQNYTDDFLKLIVLLFVWPSSFAGSRHFCLATRRQCFTLTGWDCHWVTHWVGQEVLAKRKGPGNEFESKRTADASTFNGSMRIGSYNISGVVLVLCHTSLTFE